MGNAWSKPPPRRPYNRAVSAQQHMTIEVTQVPIVRTERINRETGRIVSTTSGQGTRSSNSSDGSFSGGRICEDIMRSNRAILSSSATSSSAPSSFASSRIIRQVEVPAQRVAEQLAVPVGVLLIHWGNSEIVTANNNRNNVRTVPFAMNSCPLSDIGERMRDVNETIGKHRIRGTIVIEAALVVKMKFDPDEDKDSGSSLGTRGFERGRLYVGAEGYLDMAEGFAAQYNKPAFEEVFNSELGQDKAS
ncbi:hypothetical protein QBC34DRAFT_426712 [Podospora aff. communis PSN243]|uniref:Uncharacterized protein n=1 Tax=Podospora aff. communis PSN243 TaxID=3040156 RepID=A0AAV9GIM9_9PEZI|nr:hypothetical protein QBC34DRAFT_426712 [Podospora aff. communis PSN243]